MKLANHICGQWLEGRGEGLPLHDPVSGEQLVTVSSDGLDLAAALEFSRREGGAALRAMTYAARAAMLGGVAEVLQAKRADYFDISLRNSGATEADAGFDVDGAIFTLKSYARAGKVLGAARCLREGGRVALAKTDVFQGQHFLVPLSGVAIFINAFNFPAWGLWEKAAPALLAGVPVFVKPATPTAWLAQRMVADVVEAGVLPTGAISIVCGSARELLDHVGECDVVSFTGSADTAARIRNHPAVVARSVRVNIEADSVNSAILGPDAVPGSAEFDLAVKEVVRELTVKAGQKCTAIRRVLVPAPVARDLAAAVAARLAGMPVGNPRTAGVRVGPLVSKAQQAAALEGLARLREDAEVVYGADPGFMPVDADPQQAAFVQPTLLFCDKGLAARQVHDVEVFGPVATVLPYGDVAEAVAFARRGGGSLVASVYSADPAFVGALVPAIADLHGRIMVVDASVGANHTGHGNVMPTCLHGGPGRAGGGEELGGLRALAMYHRRHVVQGSAAVLDLLSREAADAALLGA
ncbi:3,4-dehydroadipyl-CoA semialdehyde dehydrogenase [Thauera chlorobenzoica]|uniref:3,4-dehydroadipyl-CoA semialdehyde dehydrogenase BoxD n=1 Tax=Thauera chlorobenzoica TaxID=96773 RepID=A0A1H5RXP7_9RHOO|nr:3,4-dehydroadipyl-CoA semialdehyde dehydrogenase [Thauera chlorobenzoica]APR03964.1 3,4-dehydroadipyl-CoA semialdehyde dehydrogenase BoxD [Thauera chlorobenzoica]SEF43000.1 3,4-dehydroadipyl-CoA semialdehyde dehydrogenase [Thauera chlorobenzoica]